MSDEPEAGFDPHAAVSNATTAAPLRQPAFQGGQGTEAQPGGVPVSPNSSLIMDIPVEVQIVLGSTEMAVSDLMGLQKGSTVALNRRIGEPVDVTVNGRRIARGEIIVLDNDPSRFGIRLTEVSATKPA